jgi:ribosomal protein L22
VALDELVKAKNSRRHLVFPWTQLIIARWPEKSAQFLLGLLKNAESNADVCRHTGKLIVGEGIRYGVSCG